MKYLQYERLTKYIAGMIFSVKRLKSSSYVGEDLKKDV